MKLYISLFIFFIAIGVTSAQESVTSTSLIKTNTSVVSVNEKENSKNNKEINRRKRINTTVITAQVNMLKTEVSSEKLQSLILKDLLKREGLDGSKRPLIISFNNSLGERYLIDTVTYKLNGEIIYQYISDDPQNLHSSRTPQSNAPLKSFEMNVVPGPYTLDVQVVYRGNDSGVFSYLKDYRISRDAKLSLDVKKINSTQLSVTTYESGWVFTDFKDRPQLKVSQN